MSRNLGPTYFQFPLCLLAMGQDEKTRLGYIIAFATVEAGRALWQKMALDKRESLPRDLGSPARDFIWIDHDHVVAALGARELNVRLGTIAGILTDWRAAYDFVSAHESVHGREPVLRVVTTLAFEARDKTGIDYREFAVYCAMLSQIGDKKYPVRITRDQIRRRMLGYKTESILNTCLSERTDGTKPLSSRQIGYAVAKLHERRFFARVRANERQTYYSIRHTQDELEAAVISSKTYARTFHAERRKRERDYIARLKEARAAIKADMPIKVDDSRCANDVHSRSAAMSTSVSAALSTGVSTLIETLPIETLPIETLLTKTHSIETLPIETRGNTVPREEKEKAGERAIKLDEPAEIKPKLPPPALDEVQAFAAGLHKQCSPELAAEWFEAHGSDPAWTEREWQQSCARWILGAIDKAKRKAMQLA